jgi:hypothetical protein
VEHPRPAGHWPAWHVRIVKEDWRAEHEDYVVAGELFGKLLLGRRKMSLEEWVILGKTG